MTIKLYFDFMSQPSRALFIFFKVNKIPFEPCPVALRKGEHLTDEFKTNLNRFQKVPFIHDGDFRLAESVAIVRYVAKKFDLDTNWYPKDLKAQAKVDEYLEWQHTNTRAMCATYFWKKWLYPKVTGEQLSPKQEDRITRDMIDCLNKIETIWLAETPYLSGAKITVADIFAACEIEQPRIAGFEPRQGRPVLTAWLDRVQKETGPVYDEAHSLLKKLASESAQAKL